MYLPKKVKKSFALKLFIVMLIISTIPYILNTLVLTSIVKKHIAQDTQASLQAFSSIKKKQLIDLFENKLEIINYLAKSENLYSFPSMESGNKRKNLLREHLKNYLQVNHFESLYIFNKSYKLVYSSEHDIIPPSLALATPPFISQLKKANETNKTSLSDMHSGYDNINNPLIYLISPLLDHNNLDADKFFMVFSMKADAINEIMVDALIIGESGETYLAGNDGFMRSNSKFETDNAILIKKVHSTNSKINKIMNTELPSDSHYGVFKDYRGKYVYSFQEYLGLRDKFNTDFDWKIFSEIDTSEVNAFINELRIYYLTAGLLLFILLVIFSRYFSALITKPIVHITDIAGKMALGEIPGEIEVTSIDEIGSLAVSFKKLKNRLTKVTSATMAVSAGKYDTELTPKSKNDTLINSLNQMTVSLAESKEKQTILINDIKKSNLEIEQILSCTKPICAINQDKVIEKVNTTFCKMFNLSPKDVVGKKCYEILDLPICNTKDCFMSQILQSQKRTTHQVKVNIQDEKTTDLYITAVPLKNVDGSIRGIVENLSDITESLKIQSEIKERGLEIEAQNWIKTGQNLLTDTLKGDISHTEMANKTIHFIANYIEAQVGVIYLVTDSDKSILKLISSYAFLNRKHISNSVTIGQGLVGQAALEKKTIVLNSVPDDYIKISSGLGEVAPKNIIVVPILFENLLIGVIELGSLKEFTKTQLEFLEIVKENIGVVFNSCFARENTKILLEKTLNQAEELQTQQEELRVSNEELKEQTEELKATGEKLQQQQDDLQELNTNLEEQTQYLEEQKHEIEEKNAFITQAKKEVELKAKQLEQASKYKSEFLANMSHELRTPLNSLLILSKDLADNKPKNLSPNQVEAASIIYDSGKDLLELINDILDLSKVEAGKISLEINEVDLRSLTKSIFNIFQLNAKQKGIEFKLEVSDDIPETIISDNQRLSQILKNLLSNSFKFTHEGSIKLRISSLVDDSYFNDTKLNTNDWLVFSVFDTGIGIPEDKKHLIFEAFQQADGTTSRKYGGTGLGLSISKELTHLLGGQIYLESSPGEGTTFRVLIPKVFKQNSEVNALPIQEQMGKSKYDKSTIESSIETVEADNHIKDDRDSHNENDNFVLAIEDDLNFAKILRKFCNEQGLKMIHSSNGMAGIELALKYKPTAIMLDIMLPGKDGWQILKEIRQNKQLMHIPIQIMTASQVDLEKVAFPILGILNKPVQADKLTALLESFKTDKSKQTTTIIAIDNSNYLQKELLEINSNKSLNLVYEKDLLSLNHNQNYPKASFVIINIDKEIVTYQKLANLLEAQNNNIPPIIIFCESDNLPEAKLNMNVRIKSIIVRGEKSSARFLDVLSSGESLPPTAKIKQAPVEENPSMVRDKDEHLKGKKILVVDDDMRNVFAVSHLLESREILVTSTINGQKALEILKEDNKFDLILMDIMMPVMDGETATKLIRKDEKLKDIPIIVLTAKTMKGDRERFISSGASDYLAKPLDTDKLISLLRIWLS